jgi:hypothetical protein
MPVALLIVFVGLAEREGMAITGRSGGAAWTTAGRDAYLERCQIAPGSYGPELVPHKGHNNPAEVGHLDLLDAVADSLSWSDARLAQEVAVDIETVARWRSTGIPNSYLPARRALREAAGHGRRDGLDLASLLPRGSRCRLEQARTAARAASHGSGDGPVRLVGRETHRLSGRRSR